MTRLTLSQPSTTALGLPATLLLWRLLSLILDNTALFCVGGVVCAIISRVVS